jgi:hypothetical protein
VFQRFYGLQVRPVGYLLAQDKKAKVATGLMLPKSFNYGSSFLWQHRVTEMKGLAAQC